MRHHLSYDIYTIYWLVFFILGIVTPPHTIVHTLMSPQIVMRLIVMYNTWEMFKKTFSKLFL